ncbi:MAG: BBP7 family outer membrane beta-barrel protein, partial [Planctomycetota bacterium]
MANKLLRFLTLLILCSLSTEAGAQVARNAAFNPTAIGRYEDRVAQSTQSVSNDVSSLIRNALNVAKSQGGLIPTTATNAETAARRVRYQVAQDSLILPPPSPAVSSGSLSLARPTTVRPLPESTFASPLSSRPILSTLEPLPDPILPFRQTLSNPMPMVASSPCATGTCGTCNSCQSCMQCWTRTCNNRGCGGLCCGDPCRPRFWARAEALLWWMEGYSTPPLLTSSPAGTPSDVAGVLGQPATQTLFGGGNLGDELRIGGRVTAGYWFDKCRRFGAQAEFFGLGNDDSGNRSYGPDDGILTRPFFNTDTRAQAAQLVNFPGVASGTMDFATSSHVYSASPSLRWNLLCCSDPCN